MRLEDFGYKVGDSALCKMTLNDIYHGNFFEKNKSYKITKVGHYQRMDDNFEGFIISFGDTEVINENFFIKHFYTKKEQRKNKLEKIKNKMIVETDIQPNKIINKNLIKCQIM